MKRKLLLIGAALSILVFCLSFGVRAGTPERPCPHCEDWESGYAWRPYDDNPSVHRLHCNWCGLPYSDSSGGFTLQAHSGGTATCTQQAVCEVCGAAYGDLAAHTLVTIPGFAATCTRAGQEPGSRCTVCGAVFPGRVTKRLPHWYGPWTSNGDGTISADCIRAGCRYRMTVDSQYLQATLGGFHLFVCPVSGDASITSEQVAAIDNLPQAITFQPLPGATAQALGNLPLLPGDFVAFGTAAPFGGEALSIPGFSDRPAFVLYALTACIERGGVPGRNSTVTYAFSTSITEIAPAPGAGQTLELLRASGNGQWQAIPFVHANGSLSFETDSLGLFLVIQPETIQTQE